LFFLFYCLFGRKAVSYVTGEQLRKIADRIEYGNVYLYSVLLLCRVSSFFVRFLLKESEMRLARKHLYAHANVLIRLASAIDKISFFKLFSSSCIFSPSLSLRETDHSSLSLPLVFYWNPLHYLVFCYWNEREKKIEDNLPMFDICAAIQ
jgi:hypothetical protein